MKNIKKIIGYGILTAVIGLLIFGAVNRTLANSVTSAVEVEHVDLPQVVATQSVETGDTVESTQTTFSEATLTPLELMPVGELSQEEIDALLYMREEEKMARDVYNYLASVWSLPVFTNIARSEQVHTDAVLELLVRYELSDPALPEVGAFTNPDLQALYNQLIQQSSESLETAFMVGGAIEEIDILDLEKRIALTDQVDIKQVFESLRLASFNHLNSFVGNLESRTGVIYVPQYMTMEDYQVVQATDLGTNGNGNGQGQGAGGGGNAIH